MSTKKELVTEAWDGAAIGLAAAAASMAAAKVGGSKWDLAGVKGLEDTLKLAAAASLGGIAIGWAKKQTWWKEPM